MQRHRDLIAREKEKKTERHFSVMIFKMFASRRRVCLDPAWGCLKPI